MPRTYVPKSTRAPRRLRRLSCSECGVHVEVIVPERPDLGDGWPQHRCVSVRWRARVRPFDEVDHRPLEEEPQVRPLDTLTGVR